MRLATASVLTVVLMSGTAMAAEPTGDWRVEDGSAIIRIDDCGGALWGVVAWEKEPGRDRSGRPTLGSTVIINMRPSQGRWDGQIHNAQNGETYKANVRMAGDNTLRVEGCVLGGLFCGGQRWTRVGNAGGANGRGGSGTTGRGGQSDVCARVSNLSR